MVENKQVEGKSKAPLAHKLTIERTAIFTLLKQLCEGNAEHFTNSSWSSYGERMGAACLTLLDQIPHIEDIVNQLQEISGKYDFDENTPGNGYRSLVCICDTSVLHLISLLKTVSEQRAFFVFRLSHYCKELEAFNQVLKFLLTAIPKCLEEEKTKTTNSLFPALDGDYNCSHPLLKSIEQLDSSCFYGRPLGFQFSPSVNRIFRVIGIVLASYSLTWEKGHGPIGSLLNTGRFFLSPEQRALRIIKVTKEADIAFCKGFWNLSELGNNMPKWFCPHMAINELREINWVGPLFLESTNGEKVTIPEPSAHTGPRPVQIRVLSPVHRQQMSPSNVSNQQSASPYLLFHCHGGGYVATSSKSHETYLRVWAKLLNCTVVSVEYSLAPENPFPRPTEEVLFAYAWIINNPAAVGWTGEKLCMVGDSAGGNLIMSVNLRLLQLNVKRLPDGIVPVYTPFLFQYLPSPSRVLSVMDPLLHMGVVLRCVAAYTGAYTDKTDKNTEHGETSRKSLQEYVDQVQNQRIDFSSGAQSIVTLVQNNTHSNDKRANQPSSLFVDRDSKPEDDSDEGDMDDTASVNSVHIDSDPFHIHLSSTVFDNQLLHFLLKHPTTKSSFTVLDENGETVEEGMEAIDHTDALTETKTPTASVSETMHTEISTPVEQPRVLSASVSSNNFQTIAQNVHKRSLSQSLADTAALAAGHAIDNLQEWLERPARQKLDRTTSHKTPLEEEPQVEEEYKSHMFDLLNGSFVPKEPLISPMYADDELIKKLPPCYFIACHLDPLLDDTISFAKKLRTAGGTVASIDLLPAVPHGFLNFTLMSPECRKGAKICLQRIKEALDFKDDLKVATK